ncbi:hypothetical protein Pint_08802 [Pistacia integerrima]|uniref:Uncharacterized protein n=1 Tax=Pistacia integerrima TaxID=434235 RepID=A0ACC0XX16_9ROSI|nr:hypothetical protein Pint_08802 [Pistacia integerrima]
MVFGIIYQRKWLLIVVVGCQQKLQLHKLSKYVNTKYFLKITSSVCLAIMKTTAVTLALNLSGIFSFDILQILVFMLTFFGLSNYHFLVQEALHAKGLRDDTTCIVIDMLPQEKPAAPVPQPKKQVKGVLKSMFRRKSSESTSTVDKEYVEPDVVEELFEEGSAMLSERLDTKYPLCNMFKLFMCAVCQVEVKPEEGVSIHAGSSNSGKLRPWDGPFLCLSCQEKREAMEGKRPSGERYGSDSD